MKRLILLTVLGLIFVVATTCSGTKSEEKGMIVKNVVANMAMPTDTGSFWMDITNNTGQDDALIGAEVAGCGAVELHQMSFENDVMKMSEVEGGRIPIPAGEMVQLQRGGLHVMCINKAGALKPDSTIDITLNFEHADPITMEAPVVTPGDDMPMDS